MKLATYAQAILQRWLILALAVGCLTAATGRAQNSSAAKPIKIGVVDVESITRRSTSIQAKIHAAEQSVQAQQDKIDAKTRDLQQLRDDLTNRRSVLTDTQIDEQESKIRALRDQIDDMQYQINKQLDRIREQVMDPEVDRIMKTVADVAKREGYDLVVRSEAVLYSVDKADLTPLVIQALDKPTGAGAGKPALPSTTAKPKPTPHQASHSSKPASHPSASR